MGIRSKYDEDHFTHGHSSVFGSYWHQEFGWGYRCCLAFTKDLECKGEEGKKETIKREYEHEIKNKRQNEEEQ